jgi:hypothetical protein
MVRWMALIFLFVRALLRVRLAEAASEWAPGMVAAFWKKPLAVAIPIVQNGGAGFGVTRNSITK